MYDRTRILLLHYGGALLFTVLAVLLRWVLDPWLGDHATVATLYMSVALAVWLGGHRPALLAMGVGYVACNVLFIEPRGDLSLDLPHQRLGLLSYLLCCGIIIGFGEGLRRASRAAADNQSRLEAEASRRQEVEEELRVAQRRAASVLESITDAHYTLDRGWHLVALNAHAEEYFGRPRNQLLGQVIWDLFPEGRGALVEEQYQRAMTEGVPVHFEMLSQLPPRWIEIHAYPSADTLWVFFRDITGRKQAEEALRASEARFRGTFECNMVPMGIWARDGSILDANDALLELIDYTRDELRSNAISWTKLTPPEYQPLDARSLRQIQERGVGEPYEKEYIRKDGTRVPILVAGGSFDERADSGVFFALDLSQRKGAEAQLRQLNEELQEAARRKDEFLATLAHELRNPLAPIRNALELLRRADNDDMRERARRMMERQFQRMVHLIDDLLDISRINRGKIQLRRERVELAGVVQSAVEAARPFLDAQEHELTVLLPPEPVHLDADPTRLAQVFANLLDNAAKYTEKGGHIWLTAERHDATIAVKVRDTGIGIDAEHLPRVFEMFSQVAPALERSQGGLGIGLSLVRGLVGLHGGSVEAHSGGLGKGSEFTVRLPMSEARTETLTVPDGGASPGPSQCRILVVDDNRDAADSLAMLLRLVGHHVQTAHDGLEAVQAAAAFRPQVILLDIGLPKMNGYEAARHIREQPGGEDMVLVAVTGWGQEEDKRKAREAGLDHHLTKPVDPMALDAVLAAVHP